MSKLKEAQASFKKRFNERNASLTHFNSLFVNCDETADDHTIEKCLNSYLDSSQSTSKKDEPNQSPGHQSGNDNSLSQPMKSNDGNDTLTQGGNSNSLNQGINDSLNQPTGRDGGNRVGIRGREPIIGNPQASFNRVGVMMGASGGEHGTQMVEGASAAVPSTSTTGLRSRDIAGDNNNSLMMLNHSQQQGTATDDIGEQQEEDDTVPTMLQAREKARNKLKLRKQMSGYSVWPALLTDKMSPTRQNHSAGLHQSGNRGDTEKHGGGFFLSSNHNMDSVKHLISPTKIQNMRYGEMLGNTNLACVSGGETVTVGRESGTMIQLSSNDDVLTISSSLEESSVNDCDDGEKSPLLLQRGQRVTAPKPSKEMFIRAGEREQVSAAARRSRLKAIREKSQSTDIIFL